MAGLSYGGILAQQYLGFIQLVMSHSGANDLTAMLTHFSLYAAIT